jgi:hypothetical protein
MYLITWYNDRDRKTSTVSTGEVHTIFTLACMFDKQKTKYKVTDRTGLVGPSAFGWGDFDYWLTKVDDPLY